MGLVFTLLQMRHGGIYLRLLKKMDTINTNQLGPTKVQGWALPSNYINELTQAMTWLGEQKGKGKGGEVLNPITILLLSLLFSTLTIGIGVFLACIFRRDEL